MPGVLKVGQHRGDLARGESVHSAQPGFVELRCHLLDLGAHERPPSVAAGAVLLRGVAELRGDRPGHDVVVTLHHGVLAGDPQNLFVGRLRLLGDRTIDLVPRPELVQRRVGRDDPCHALHVAHQGVRARVLREHLAEREGAAVDGLGGLDPSQHPGN